MTELNTTKVTRVEVNYYANGEGETFALYGADAVMWDIQDDGRTLKIFVSGGSSLPDYNFMTGDMK